MKNLFAIAMVAIVVWAVYSKHHAQVFKEESARIRAEEPVEKEASSPFTCDGRTYCSQMTSCAEAKFFVSNCPGTKMDGDRDGIPCEQQWCTR